MSSKIEPHEQMDRLRGICDSMVTALDDAFNTAIRTKEKEFLVSYKDHINEVQLDLDKMKNDAEDIHKNIHLDQFQIDDDAGVKPKTFIDMKQERIQLLEEKLEYYRQATTYLDQQCLKQRTTMKNIKKKVQILQEDHDFYETQIKKERKITLDLQEKIAKCIDQYDEKVFGMEKI